MNDRDTAGAAVETFVRAKFPRYSEASISRQEAAIARDIERDRQWNERDSAEGRAREYWAGLVRRHSIGEAYLRSLRGLDPVALGDHVRFDGDGNPALALHHLETGEVVNVVRRIIRPTGPKCVGLRGCGVRGSFIHRALDVQPDGLDVAVVVEGVMDSLAGAEAFPTCAVLGTHSAGSIPSLVDAVVPRVVAARGWLLLVVHADARNGEAGAGERAAIAAARHAMSAGLVLDRSLRIVDLGPHKDLADAWAAGWRWQW